MKRRVLVIGSSGFIGASLCSQLVTKKHIVTGLDLQKMAESCLLHHFYQTDYQHCDYLESLIIKNDIIYLLSSSTIPAISNQIPLHDIESNLKGSVRILEILRKYPDKKIIFISSGGTVYGESNATPIDENHSTNPICSYGIIKLAIEKYIQMYSKLYGIKFTIFRLSNPYGKNQLKNEGKGLIASLILRIQHNKRIDIWGDGSVIRDYLYIDDVINALVIAINYTGSENIFNLSSGIGYSTTEIITQVQNQLNKQGDIHYNKMRDFDVQYNALNIYRIKKEFFWKPTIDITSGINKIVNEKNLRRRKNNIEHKNTTDEIINIQLKT